MEEVSSLSAQSWHASQGGEPSLWLSWSGGMCVSFHVQYFSSLGGQTLLFPPSEDQQQGQVGLGRWAWGLVSSACLGPSGLESVLLEEDWPSDSPCHMLSIPTTAPEIRERERVAVSVPHCSCAYLVSQLPWKTGRTTDTISCSLLRPREVQ